MAEQGYQVEIEMVAAKALLRFDRPTQLRLRNVIAGLENEPRPHGAIKLTGTDGYRIRVGDYRIVYLIEDEIKVVTVTRIAHRRDVYRRL